MTEKNNKLTLEVLLNHKKDFVKIFSAYYPLPVRLLEDYAHLWDWSLVSRNIVIDWNEAIIEQFQDKWNWTYYGLSNNNSLPWSVHLLERFKERWSWYHLGWLSAIVDDPDMLATCFQHWDNRCQENLFGWAMPAINQEKSSWAENFFENCSTLNWKLFSKYRGFPWTATFIHKHASKWDWGRLSNNKGLPWNKDLIEKYKDKWDWKWLSANEKLPWSKELIEAFEDYWDWEQLSGNEGVKWTTNLLDSFIERWYWASPVFLDFAYQYVKGLINHKDLLWTPSLFEKYVLYIDRHFEKLRKTYGDSFTMTDTDYWTFYQDPSNWSESYFKMLIEKNLQQPDIEFIDWTEVEHKTAQLHFIKELFEGYNYLQNNVQYDYYNILMDSFLNDLKEHQDFYVDSYLLTTKDLPLTKELIYKYKNKWNWTDLSKRSDLTLEIIATFEECWDWEALSRNPSLTYDVIQQYTEKWSWWWLAETKLHSYSIENSKPEARLDLEKLVDLELLEQFLSALT